VGFNEIGPANKSGDNTLKAAPNPFDRGTHIIIDPKKTTKNIKVEIYDNHGFLVRNVLNTQLAEYQDIYWQGDDNNGNQLPTGLYHLVMFSADKEIKSLKIIKR
jgi:flagellar hook assembly protein FlgD